MVFCLYGNGNGPDFVLRGHLLVGDATPRDQINSGKQHGGLARLRRQFDWFLLAVG